MIDRLRLQSEAEVDFGEAIGFYEVRREGMGIAFVEAVERAFQEIVDAPLAGGLCYVDRPYPKWLVRKFPFVVVYRVEPPEVVVIAISHTSRRHGYWLSRERSQ